MTAAKVCPFCGKAPTIEFDARFITCKNAACPAKPSIRSDHDALDLWNTRYPRDGAPEAVAQARALSWLERWLLG